MSEAVIKVVNISKKFSIRPEKQKGTKQSFLQKFTSGIFPATTKDIWALKDISFEINQGESVGVIGMNGAGKSTLLKILSDIIRPTSGTIEISGKLAAILDIGIGFNQELSGRDNISLYGKMLGFTKSQIVSKMDEIVAFSGIHDFIDTPVKLYSSGMLMRLGFAVIASLDADIILLDEILAVGDVIFRNKCVNKIIDLKNKKKTMVIVGHDLNDISNYCDKIILLHNGILVETGTPVVIINTYQKIILEEKKQKGINIRKNYNKKKLNILFSENYNNLKTAIDFDGAEQVSSDTFSLLSASIGMHGSSVDNKPLASDSEIQININTKYHKGRGDLAFVIRDIMNYKIFGQFAFAGHKTELTENSDYKLQWIIPGNIFNEGIFKLGVTLFDENYRPVYNIHEVLIFEIICSSKPVMNFDFFTPVNPAIQFKYSKNDL